MNGRLERRLPLAKEYRTMITRDGPNLFAWVKPSNLKAERISVMLLRALDISYWQLRHWRANRGHFHFCVHGAFLCSSLCNKTANASTRDITNCRRLLKSRAVCRNLLGTYLLFRRACSSAG